MTSTRKILEKRFFGPLRFHYNTALTLIWDGWGGVISPLLVSYNNSETLNAVTLFAAVSNISLETSVPNLIFLTSPNLQILGKILTGVFPISGFSVNSL